MASCGHNPWHVHGIANRLARQQEEYEEYLVERLQTKRRATWLGYGLRSEQHKMLPLRWKMTLDP